MMEIAIKIPDKIYKFVQNASFVENESTLFKQTSAERQKTLFLFDILDAIKDGTPLPKQHGRLIDADYMIKQLLSLPKDELSTEDAWAMKVLGLAPTIIEADKLSNNELENPFNDSRFGG